MCRYSEKQYKSSYVCFDCRLAFKKPRYWNVERKCPACGKVMKDMGRDFKAPRRKDARAWRRLPRHVLRPFDSCGCAGSRNDLRRKRKRVWRYASQAQSGVKGTTYRR